VKYSRYTSQIKCDITVTKEIQKILKKKSTLGLGSFWSMADQIKNAYGKCLTEFYRFWYISFISVNIKYDIMKINFGLEKSWMEVHETYWGVLLKFVDMFQFWLKSDNNGHLTWRPTCTSEHGSEYMGNSQIAAQPSGESSVMISSPRQIGARHPAHAKIIDTRPLWCHWHNHNCQK
jgi:hypothetical protein